MSPPPTYFPLRWESTGDQWWYASPIDYAAANGHYDLVRELLRLDGNHLIKLTSLRRVRRLETVWDDDEHFSAVANHRSAVAKSLLAECDAKKGKNSLIGAGYGGWLLYTAASAGDLGFVKELLNERDPLLVFGEGEYGVTDILYAAARSRNSEVFKVVLDFATAPRFSTAETAAEVPEAYKAEIMNRAIHAAARGGNLELLKELTGGGADEFLAYRDVQGATVLHAAAARGQVEVVKDLISSSGMIAATDNLGNTALHVAAHRGHLPVVEALILVSPSLITAKNNAGETFLHSVITGFQTPGFRRLDKQISLLKHLISGKLFSTEDIINVRDSSGRTVLHHAIMGNIHSDLVELLMTVRSIDVNIRDADGMTPLDILKRRPHSASSDLLTKQLVSAGGIFTSEEEYYSVRKAIASHIKRQSMGGSPGTSFRISDVEILLYTGMENASPDGIRSRGRSPCSPDQASGNRSPRKKTPKTSSVNYLKRLLNWPRMKNRTSDRLKRVVEGSSGSASGAVPLRQRFSKPNSPSSAAITCNKRTRSGRSDAPNPAAEKKLASGVVQGVMQAVPKHRSRSSSFSKLSWSSHSSLDAQKGGQIDNEMAKASCSSAATVNNEGRRSTIHRHSFVNQYLCFGGAGQHVEGALGGGEIQPYEVYERSVLSAA